MKKFFTLAITMAFLSALMPTKVWAGSYSAKITAIAEPSNGGNVAVTSGNLPSSYSASSPLTQEASWYKDKTFYLYAQTNNDYVFKGWATSTSANSGTERNPYSETLETKLICNEKTFYAIFARLAANTNSVTFSPQNVQSTSSEQTITISHAHAGQVTAELSGDNPSDFTISSTTLVQNSTSEGSVNLTITFTPTCSGNRRATLTIKSNNGLADVKIILSGTGVAHPQDISWDEPINTTIQVGEQGRSISATAPSGLDVTYFSSDPNVLSVDANGKLTANAIGTAIITATVASDCYYASKSITKEFTVLSKKTPSFWLENDPNLTEKALLVDETTTVTVQNIDDSNSDFSITSSNNNIVSCSSIVDGIATITAKNAGTATLTFNQTETDNVLGASSTFTFNISKHQGTLSINSTLGNTYKVDDVIGDYTSFYTASNNEVQVKVESSNTDVIAIENNKLKAVGAGKATITFSQAETYKWVSTTASKEITVEKYTLSASINQSTATWDETISNPFTVTDDRRNAFTSYTVTPQNPDIADYVNGEIVTYSTNGTAQFIISYDETVKYKALNQTVDLSVAAAAESECYVLDDATEYKYLYGNSKTFNLSGEGDILSVDLKKYADLTTSTFIIDGYSEAGGQGTKTNILTQNVTTTYTNYSASIARKGYKSIVITVDGTPKYSRNLKVTRLKDLNASATSVEAEVAPGVSPSGSFDVNYSDCGSTFTVRSSNPKIAVSPTTFNNVSAGSGTQKISFTGDTQATGKETATITVYNQSRRVEVPVTCYQQYTVSFVTGTDESIKDQTVTYEKQYNTLPAPDREGYTFAGWFTAADEGTEVTNTTICKQTANHTLYAHWTPNTYDLILDYNYTNAPANATRSGFFTYDATYDIDIKEMPGDNIHPVGYHFDGWYSDEACTQAFSLSGTYTTAGNTTIYAKWAPNKYGLTLYYNYEGAPKNGILKTDATYFTFDAQYDIQEVPGENDHPIGYHFDGWYADADGTGDQWTSGTYKTADHTVLYAKWTINTYDLTFVLNDGSWVGTAPADNKITLTYGQTYGDQLASEKIERSGYTFQGWFSDANFATDSKVEANDVVGLIPPTTLYAKWLINALTATFDANYPNGRQGAAYSFSSSVRIGETYTLPETNPSIDGYAFAGWRTETNIMVDASTFCQIGKNHTLYGCWTANSYEVSYDPNQGNWSGNGQPTKVNLTYDQTYGQDSKFPAAPTRDGYTFQGWWTAEADGQQVTANTVFETAGNQTLYAHWSSNNYKLIFDYKDEAGTFEAVDVTYDDNYPTVNKVPTRVGFTFVGWYDANNTLVDLSKLPDRTYTTAGNERFFAHWIPNHYTVKFKTDADSKVIDSMSISVAYHDVYGILPKLKENGQEVTTEWYDAPADGMLVTPTTIFQPANVNQEFILYATTNPEKFALQLVDGNQTTTIGISEGQTYAEALNAAGIIKEETGKTFLGWSATQNGTAKDLSEGFSTDCQTLYALWENKQLHVSFVDTEHTTAVYGDMDVAFGDTYANGTRGNATGLPTVASVDGKTFNGWSTSDVQANIVMNTTPVDLNVKTLYAHWTANNYTIYLHENTGVDKSSAINVTYGETYTLTAPAERTGYTFAGWFTKQEGGDHYDLTTRTYEIVGDLHLYAHWTAVSGITVSFNANGGKDASSISATYGQAYGNLPTTTKEGYTFVGWFTAAEGGTEVTNTTICKQTANHNLYAHWTANNYTIYLHENTGVDKTSAIDVTYGGNYTLTAPAGRTGYTFEGWFTKQEGGDHYDLTTRTYTKVGDLHLYAQWTAVSGITVSFNADGGEAVTNSISATYGQAYGNLPTTTKAGYTFVGWFNADGNIVSSEDICRNATSHTLTAHWTATAYTITFDANGGECHTTNKQVVYNTAIGKLPLVTRDGYTFNGWWASDASEATTEKDIFDGFDNLTLTAHWEACQYTVSFLPEGGTTTADNKQVTYQAKYGDLPTATRDGYKFDGWFTCDNEPITSNTTYTKIGNQELHAHWTAEKFTVTFSVATGVNLDTQSKEVTFDSPYGELPTPTLAGYEFTGWYTTQYGGSLVSHSTIVSTAQAHTLYAHWTGADVTIHFNSNGGSEVADVTRKYQANYCEPALPTPTKEGYLFIGWYLDGTLVTNNTIVDRTEAHTLTASWAEADVPYLVVGNNWNILSEEANNDYRFKTADGKNYSLSNIRVDADRSLDGEPTIYQADITIFLNGVFYGVAQGQTGVLQTTENGNSCLFTTNNTTWATFQSAEMLTRWFNFDLYEESSGTWRLSISCGKQGNPTEVDNNESEQPARAKKYVEDGKVFIQTKEDRIYNASGQLVK